MIKRKCKKENMKKLRKFLIAFYEKKYNLELKMKEIWNLYEMIVIEIPNIDMR